MILVNSAAIRAHIEELESVRRNLDRLDSFVTSLKNKAASKAARFDAVQLCGAWTGAAAREFEDELRRTRQQVDRASEGATAASAVITAEKVRILAKLAVANAQLAVAVALEAAERAAAQKGTA